MDEKEKDVETAQPQEATETDNMAEAAAGAAETDAAAGEPEGAPAEDALAKAEAEMAELRDKHLRLMAEFDNYKKRTLREKAELILGGSEKAVCAILPVIDDMERALANRGKGESLEQVEQGWDLIVKKLHKALATLGVKAIETEGKDFDVDYHEAVAMVPGMGDEKKGKVIDCVQTGYTLGDKVIRHAKVAVGQ